MEEGEGNRLYSSLVECARPRSKLKVYNKNTFVYYIVSSYIYTSKRRKTEKKNSSSSGYEDSRSVLSRRNCVPTLTTNFFFTIKPYQNYFDRYKQFLFLFDSFPYFNDREGLTPTVI